MDLNEFNEDYLNVLLEKLSEENKTVFLLGDFNIDLLKCDKNSSTNDFLDSLSSNLFLPNIVFPTRIVEESKTLIGDIFTNHLNLETVSGNITASISDHLPQFSIFPNIFAYSPTPKLNIYERDWKQFNQQEFILDFFSTDWVSIINLDQNNVDRSFNSFLKTFNVLLY